LQIPPLKTTDSLLVSGLKDGLTGVVISVKNLGFKSLRWIADICKLGHSRFVEGAKGFTPDTNTPIYWIAFQIKKRELLTSIYALCPIGQSEQ